MGMEKMVDIAAKGQDRMAQMNAVLTSTKGAAGMTEKALVDLATAQGKLSLQSKGANIETENLLLTFTSIGKDVFPQALSTVNDMSQALGQDTKSSAIQLGKALNDPINGMTALKRVGVNFTDSQKEQIKTLQESGDLMGAQKIILAELGTEFGGSALAASKTFDGQMTVLKNSISSMGGSIGNVVLPYLTQFMTWVNDHMPQIQKFMTDAMTAIGSALKIATDFVINNLMPAFIGIYNWILPYMPAIKQFVTDCFNAIKDIFKILANYITNVLIPAFDSFLKWIQPYMPQIRKFVEDAFNAIKEVMRIVSDFIKNDVLPVYSSLAKWFVENFPKIKDAVMQAYNYIKPSFDKLVKTVKDDLLPIIMGLWDLIKKAMPGIQSIFEIVFPLLVLAVKLIIDSIADFIKDVKGIYDFVKPGLDLLVDGFNVAFGAIKTVIQGVQKVLDFFNGTKVSSKTISTSYSDAGIGHNAAGTDNWRGGLTSINELGGEIIDLPSGSRVIPHDVSMEMAKNKADKGGDIYYVTIDAKNVDDFNKVVDLCKDLNQAKRAY